MYTPAKKRRAAVGGCGHQRAAKAKKAKKHKSSVSSQYRGASWKKSHQKWAAQITDDGKTNHIGCFEDEEAAARAVDSPGAHLGEFWATGWVRGEGRREGQAAQAAGGAN
jgi:hypothetical protein